MYFCIKKKKNTFFSKFLAKWAMPPTLWWYPCIWTKCWRTVLSSKKSVNTTFTLRSIHVYLDELLTYGHHIHTKRAELDLRFHRLSSWQLNLPYCCQSSSLLYMESLQPVWVYAIRVWGCASKSCCQIIQQFQNKTLRTILSTLWYVSKDTIHYDL